MTEQQSPWFTRWWLHAIVVPLVFFAAIAPTLTWLEFSGGMENVTVATAREVVYYNKTATWLVPSLNDEPRLRKPPLVHWITALGLMSSDNLGWGARWPSLLAACLMLSAVYGLGRTVGDWRLGLIASAICGSTVLFIQYARQAQYDVHLALWVVVANLCLAKVIFDGWWLRGCAGAGAAIGLALLAKGPPSIVQTIVPIMAFALWWRFSRVADVHIGASVAADGVLGYASTTTPTAAIPLENRPPRPSGARKIAAIALGVGVMLAVMLPWVAYVIIEIPNVIRLWKVESTVGVEARYETRSQWYDYLQNLWRLLPWLVWFFIGMWFIVADRRKPEGRRQMLMLFLAVLPVIIMSFFAVRRNRYLLPMLGPATVIAARGFVEHLRRWPRWDAGGITAVGLHWLILAAMAALPIAGAMGVAELRDIDGAPWYTWRMGAIAAAAMGLIVLIGIAWHRRWPGALVTATVAFMLIWQAVFVWGYKDSAEGRSAKPLADLILRHYPTARVYNAHPTGKSTPLEMTVYLNRPVPPRTTDYEVSDSPQVILVPDRLHADGRPLSESLPANAILLNPEDLGRRYWLAYVLEPKVSPAPPMRPPPLSKTAAKRPTTKTAKPKAPPASAR